MYTRIQNWENHNERGYELGMNWDYIAPIDIILLSRGINLHG